MRRAPLLLAALVALTAFLPAPVLAAACSETTPHIRFDANPKTDVAVGSETRFSFKFRFAAPCDGDGVATPSVTLQGETHQIYNSIDTVVRRTPLWDMIPNLEFRDATDDNWDFNATVATRPGQYQFYGRVLLDDAQITQSAPVTVTVAGEAPTGGPADSGGEPEPAAGPVDLAVTIGTYASAADIPSYVAALYRYGLGVGVTLAMVMVVVGGFQYMTARGNPSAIGAARGRITNAVLGLLLLLGSFTLLQTINPDLVTLRNIYVPEIQSVELLDENKCEDYNREEYTVEPTVGRCGEEGTVSRRDGGNLATNTCTWGVCSGENEACVLRGRSGYGCVSCHTVIDDNLTDWGLTENDAACARFTPTDSGEVRNGCVLSEGGEFDLTNDVCALIHVDCSAVDRCGDYDAALTATHGDEDIRLEAFGHGGDADQMRFREWCERNPCNAAPGSCHAVSNAGSFGASFAGDAWGCAEGPG